MPVIARFYGILIKMYFREHGAPHFHAIYGEFNGVFDVTSVEMIEGDLPPRAQRLVRDWGMEPEAAAAGLVDAVRLVERSVIDPAEAVDDTTNS